MARVRGRRGEAAALDPREMAADAIDLADRRARAEQRRGQRLLVRERQPVARQAGQRRGAAAQQDEDEIVRPGLAGEREQPLGRGDAGLVGDRMAGMEQRRSARASAVDAVRHDGDAGRARADNAPPRPPPSRPPPCRARARRRPAGAAADAAAARCAGGRRRSRPGTSVPDGRASRSGCRPRARASTRPWRGGAHGGGGRSIWLLRIVAGIVAVPLALFPRRLVPRRGAGQRRLPPAGRGDHHLRPLERRPHLDRHAQGQRRDGLAALCPARASARPALGQCRSCRDRLRQSRILSEHADLGRSFARAPPRSPCSAAARPCSMSSMSTGRAPSPGSGRSGSRRDQYRRLAGFIQRRFRLDPGGRPIPVLGRGYGAYDMFYEANGGYSFVMTCNEWTGRALRARRRAHRPVDAVRAEHHVASRLSARACAREARRPNKGDAQWRRFSAISIWRC